MKINYPCLKDNWRSKERLVWKESVLDQLIEDGYGIRSLEDNYVHCQLCYIQTMNTLYEVLHK